VRLSRGSMFSQEGLTILLLYCLACLHSFLLLLLAELLLGQPLLSILSFACLALLHLRIFTAVRHVHTITIRVCTVSFSIVIVIISMCDSVRQCSTVRQCEWQFVAVRTAVCSQCAWQYCC